MRASIFSWYGGLFYQRASILEEEVVGARDPRRGPININKPTAPDPHHLATWDENMYQEKKNPLW